MEADQGDHRPLPQMLRGEPHRMAHAQALRRRLVTPPQVPHAVAQPERLVLPVVVVVADAEARRRRHRSKR